MAEPIPQDSEENAQGSNFDDDMRTISEEMASSAAPSLNDVLGELDSKKPPTKASEGDILHKRENARAWLAKSLVYSLWGTLVVTFALIVIDRFIIYSGKKIDNDQGKDFITLIWTAQTTLVGTALGFYFGDRDS